MTVRVVNQGSHSGEPVKHTQKNMLPAADKILGHAGTVEGIKGGTAAAKVVMKFAALQKTIPSLSALASSQPFGYIASSLATITSFLGLALCVLNIAKKNRFITCLESLKDKKKLGKKDEAFFKTLISKQTNMVSILSEEFVKKHNIQGECFSQLSNDELEMIIQQVKYKRTIDIIAAVITVISIGILIASFITAPPLWLTFVPIILFLIAYIVEKKIDSNGQSSVIDMLTPAFIKDLKNQDILVKYLQFGDLYQWFNNNTAIFAFYLTSEEMELLKKEAKKIDKAIVGNAPNVEELKKEFSKRCKEMLESKTTRDKVETVGTALFLGGAGFMLAPFGLWALAVVIPTIMIGCLLKFKPTLFAPGLGKKEANPSLVTGAGAQSTIALPVGNLFNILGD